MKKDEGVTGDFTPSARSQASAEGFCWGSIFGFSIALAGALLVAYRAGGVNLGSAAEWVGGGGAVLVGLLGIYIAYGSQRVARSGLIVAIESQRRSKEADLKREAICAHDLVLACVEFRVWVEGTVTSFDALKNFRSSQFVLHQCKDAKLKHLERLYELKTMARDLPAENIGDLLSLCESARMAQSLADDTIALIEESVEQIEKVRNESVIDAEERELDLAAESESQLREMLIHMDSRVEKFVSSVSSSVRLPIDVELIRQSVLFRNALL